MKRIPGWRSPQEIPFLRTLLSVLFKEYMTLLSYSCKMKRENGISRLVSTLGVDCKYTTRYNSGNSRNIPECWLLNNLVVHLVWTTSET